MNRIDALFQKKKKNILSVFYTAGFPKLNATLEVALLLEQNGIDMLEIGIPYSDPLADGPVIQQSSTVAIENGMSLDVLFKQLKTFRKECTLPALLMGYLNPVLQFGFEKFCAQCKTAGIDGLIIPDLPLSEFEKYQPVLKKNGLHFIFLITPQTSKDRIRMIDNLSTGFIYMVSSASTTGKIAGFSKEQIGYFRRIQRMKLKNPVLTGFGIHNAETFAGACKYSSGAIVGSHFLKLLKKNPPKKAVKQFVKSFAG